MQSTELDSQVRLQVGIAETALRQARNSYDAAVEARRCNNKRSMWNRRATMRALTGAYDRIQYERNLAQAESAEVSALGVYAKSKSALERAADLTLKNNIVSIEEAYDGKVSRPPSTLPAVELRADFASTATDVLFWTMEPSNVWLYLKFRSYYLSSYAEEYSHRR